MASNTEEGRAFRQVIGEQIQDRSRNARLEFSRLVQQGVGHQTYRHRFFPLSEGPCRAAAGMLPRGKRGEGSSGFLFSPSELTAEAPRRAVEDDVLPKVLPKSTVYKGGIGTAATASGVNGWRMSQPSYVSTLISTAIYILLLINIDAAKHHRKEGLCRWDTTTSFEPRVFSP